jgi:hypothetical protein
MFDIKSEGKGLPKGDHFPKDNQTLKEKIV